MPRKFMGAYYRTRRGQRQVRFFRGAAQADGRQPRGRQPTTDKAGPQAARDVAAARKAPLERRFRLSPVEKSRPAVGCRPSAVAHISSRCRAQSAPPASAQLSPHKVSLNYAKRPQCPAWETTYDLRLTTYGCAEQREARHGSAPSGTTADSRQPTAAVAVFREATTSKNVSRPTCRAAESRKAPASAPCRRGILPRHKAPAPRKSLYRKSPRPSAVDRRPSPISRVAAAREASLYATPPKDTRGQSLKIPRQSAKTCGGKLATCV